jgi:mannose-6-phosphate isomerase
MIYPIKFNPILKPTIWGGNRINQLKQIADGQSTVGESWEISAVSGFESVVANGVYRGYDLPSLVRLLKEELVGADNYARFGDKFPLLVKFIDAHDDLSIQVHPNDTLAMQRHHSLGKSEMWYVLSADEGAHLIAGFSQKITPQQYLEKVKDGSFVDVLQTYYVKPGDVYYIPAGRVHSLGKGTMVVEVQETSDITYRIFDYNRKDKKGNLRQLHVVEATDAIDFGDIAGEAKIDYRLTENKSVELVSSPKFTTSVYRLTEEMTCDYTELDTFVILVCTEGTCQVVLDDATETIRTGETVLLPAVTQEAKLIPDKLAILLEVYA